MNDFKKGLLVGMFIIIVCGTFIASSSKEDVGRYIIYKNDVIPNFFLLDTKSGDLYVQSDDLKSWNEVSVIPQ